MQFESRIKRNLFASMALGLVSDALIAACFALFTSTGLLGFLGVLIGLQALYFFIWLKGALWQWLLFSITNRKKMTTQVLDILRGNRFPEPDDYIAGADAYLIGVMKSQQSPCEVRIRAASEAAGLETVKSLGFFFLSLSLHLAWEDAIEQYKRTFWKIDDSPERFE